MIYKVTHSLKYKNINLEVDWKINKIIVIWEIILSFFVTKLKFNWFFVPYLHHGIRDDIRCFWAQLLNLR